MNKRFTPYCLLGLTLLSACRDKYLPDLQNQANGYLVVQGFINVGTGPTNIQLTRATSLDSSFVQYETGAQVEVQAASGASYPLTEISNGKYSISQVPVSPGEQYRLHIHTSYGKDYLSDLSDIKITPPIDTVTWKAADDGVTVYVSAHDDQNKTQYYQWQFEETWQYHSFYQSVYLYSNFTLIPRTADQMVYTCWRSNPSSDISIASTSRLKADVISDFPLTKLPFSSTDKLGIKYSIQVKQYALTKTWYDWEQMVQKNTEQLGSIFDAQPSQTGGNIHSTTDPAELVIGFVGCTSETTKRIFIDHMQIPYARIYTGDENCSLDTIKYDPAVMAAYLSYPNALAVSIVYTGPVPTGVNITDAKCADCTLKGGSTVKPDFWP